MEIREFRLPVDFEAVIDLWRNAGPGVHLSQSDSLVEITKKLARDPDLFLVAVEGGQVVGAVLGGFDGRRGIVYHLAVDACRRGQGIGSALMVDVEARLRARGCIKAYLLVADENPGVMDFYQRRGWATMGVETLGKEFGD
jgi:ribosomal protein S18 acetylase RimI-like enzyme